MYRSIKILIIFICISLLQNCEKKGISPVPPSVPELSKISMPDTVWLEKDSEFRIEASLSNRFDSDEAFSVIVTLTAEEGSSSRIYTLFDKGESGDLITKDGLFSGKFSSLDFVDSPGIYNVRFQLSGPGISSENVLSKTVLCLEGGGNSPPGISIPIIPRIISLDAPSAIYVIAVDAIDPDGRDDISSVEGRVYFPNSPVQNLTIKLRHLDQAADTTFGPDTYIFLFRPEDIAHQGKGEYFIIFSAIDKKGARSGETVKRIHFVSSIQNQPPLLTDLNAPDSLIASGDTLKLSIRATDPNGQDDIFRVWFDSFLPNGDPAKGNPFTMFDDGGELSGENIRSGDLIRGDGIYSLIIQGPVPGQSGEFRFVFQAVDKQNALSNTVEHIIHVQDQ